MRLRAQATLKIELMFGKDDICADEAGKYFQSHGARLND
jgi:hypothetical protein